VTVTLPPQYDQAVARTNAYVAGLVNLPDSTNTTASFSGDDGENKTKLIEINVYPHS